MVLKTMTLQEPFLKTIGSLECYQQLFTYIINWYDLSMLINACVNPLIHYIFGKEFKQGLTRRMSRISKRANIVYYNTTRPRTGDRSCSVVRTQKDGQRCTIMEEDNDRDVCSAIELFQIPSILRTTKTSNTNRIQFARKRSLYSE